MRRLCRQQIGSVAWRPAALRSPTHYISTLWCQLARSDNHAGPRATEHTHLHAKTCLHNSSFAHLRSPFSFASARLRLAVRLVRFARWRSTRCPNNNQPTLPYSGTKKSTLVQFSYFWCIYSGHVLAFNAGIVSTPPHSCFCTHYFGKHKTPKKIKFFSQLGMLFCNKMAMKSTHRLQQCHYWMLRVARLPV